MYVPYAVGVALTISAVFYAVRRRQRPAPSTGTQRNAMVFQQKVASIDGSLDSGHTVTKESPYPADWLASSDHFALDRRAIFSKTLVPLAHASQFSQPGSYRLVNHPAGYPVIIVLGKDFILRGFHNVCRHRAYPVVSNRQSGCTPLLACGYHGWMYNLKGELVKAPKFDGLEDFRKNENSLFEVHIRVDTEGVVWVNVSAVPEAQSELDVGSFIKYSVVTWELEGAFNWRLAELDGAFEFRELTRKHSEKGWLRALLRLVSPYQDRRHTSHSILTQMLLLSRLDTSVIITIRPVEPEKSTVQCMVVRPPHTTNTPGLVEDIRAHLLHSVTTLEDCHTRITATGTIQSHATFSAIIQKEEAHRKEEVIAGCLIWPAAEIMTRATPQVGIFELLAGASNKSKAKPRCEKEGHKHDSLAW